MNMAERVGRSSWLFQYQVHTLLAAVQSRLAHHQSRLESWKRQREDAITKLRTAGFEIRDHTSYESISNTLSEHGVQVVVDRALQERAAECSRKVLEHQGKVDEFERWLAVLASQPAAQSYDLTMDDALYFGAAKNAAAE